jgi:hypothetical protein
LVLAPEISISPTRFRIGTSSFAHGELSVPSTPITLESRM